MARRKKVRFHPGRNGHFLTGSGGSNADDGTGQGDSIVEKRAREHFSGCLSNGDDVIRIAAIMREMTTNAFARIRRFAENFRQMPQELGVVPFIRHAVDDIRCSESCARP